MASRYERHYGLNPSKKGEGGGGYGDPNWASRTASTSIMSKSSINTNLDPDSVYFNGQFHNRNNLARVLKNFTPRLVDKGIFSNIGHDTPTYNPTSDSMQSMLHKTPIRSKDDVTAMVQNFTRAHPNVPPSYRAQAFSAFYAAMAYDPGNFHLRQFISEEQEIRTSQSQDVSEQDTSGVSTGIDPETLADPVTDTPADVKRDNFPHEDIDRFLAGHGNDDGGDPNQDDVAQGADDNADSNNPKVAAPGADDNAATGRVVVKEEEALGLNPEGIPIAYEVERDPAEAPAEPNPDNPTVDAPAEPNPDITAVDAPAEPFPDITAVDAPAVPNEGDAVDPDTTLSDDENPSNPSWLDRTIFDFPAGIPYDKNTNESYFEKFDEIMRKHAKDKTDAAILLKFLVETNALVKFSRPRPKTRNKPAGRTYARRKSFRTLWKQRFFDYKLVLNATINNTESSTASQSDLTPPIPRALQINTPTTPPRPPQPTTPLTPPIPRALQINTPTTPPRSPQTTTPLTPPIPRALQINTPTNTPGSRDPDNLEGTLLGSADESVTPPDTSIGRDGGDGDSNNADGIDSDESVTPPDTSIGRDGGDAGTVTGESVTLPDTSIGGDGGNPLTTPGGADDDYDYGPILSEPYVANEGRGSLFLKILRAVVMLTAMLAPLLSQLTHVGSLVTGATVPDLSNGNGQMDAVMLASIQHGMRELTGFDISPQALYKRTNEFGNTYLSPDRKAHFAQRTLDTFGDDTNFLSNILVRFSAALVTGDVRPESNELMEALEAQWAYGKDLSFGIKFTIMESEKYLLQQARRVNDVFGLTVLKTATTAGVAGVLGTPVVLHATCYYMMGLLLQYIEARSLSTANGAGDPILRKIQLLDIAMQDWLKFTEANVKDDADRNRLEQAYTFTQFMFSTKEAVLSVFDKKDAWTPRHLLLQQNAASRLRMVAERRQPNWSERTAERRVTGGIPGIVYGTAADVVQTIGEAPAKTQEQILSQLAPALDALKDTPRITTTAFKGILRGVMQLYNVATMDLLPFALGDPDFYSRAIGGLEFRARSEKVPRYRALPPASSQASTPGTALSAPSATPTPSPTPKSRNFLQRVEAFADPEFPYYSRVIGGVEIGHPGRRPTPLLQTLASAGPVPQSSGRALALSTTPSAPRATPVPSSTPSPTPTSENFPDILRRGATQLYNVADHGLLDLAAYGLSYVIDRGYQ